MFGFNFFGLKITEVDGVNYKVSNINSKLIMGLAAKYWTSKIPNNMFLDITKNSFTFRKFYAFDLHFLCESVLNDKKKSRYTNVKLVNDLKKLLESDTWLSNLAKQFPPRLNLGLIEKNLNYIPKDYHSNFFEAYSTEVPKLGLNGYLFAGAPGSGKTKGSLVIAECVESEVIVIVAPKNSIYKVWEHTILYDNFYKNPQSLYIVADGGTYRNERIILAHYEVIEKVFPLVGSKIGAKFTVILDESHNLNDIDAIRTQNFLQLCRITKSRDILFLSGTPIKALGAETIPLLTALDPLFDAVVAASFRKIHGTSATYTNDLIAARLGLFTFKVEKHELGLEPVDMFVQSVAFEGSEKFTLKEIAKEIAVFIKEREAYFRLHKDRYVKIFNDAISLYREINSNDKAKLAELTAYLSDVDAVKEAHRTNSLRMVKDEIKRTNIFENKNIIPILSPEGKKEFRDAKTVVKYVSLKIQGECLGRVIGRKRIDACIAIIEHTPFSDIINSTVKKTILFTTYIEALDAAAKVTREMGYNPIVVGGKLIKDLNSSVEQFGNDDTINPLIATYASLSTAVPLVMADTMVLMNVPFRAYIQEQAISRIHRLGMDSVAKVITLTLDTGKELNISNRSIDILKWSQEQVESIMGIKTPFEITDKKFEATDTEFDNISIESFNLLVDEVIHDQPMAIRPTFMEW